MKVLIGVDPHKASVAVAAIDEATGELLDRASFPQDRSGLRSLERLGPRASCAAYGPRATPRPASVSAWPQRCCA